MNRRYAIYAIDENARKGGDRSRGRRKIYWCVNLNWSLLKSKRSKTTRGVGQVVLTIRAKGFKRRRIGRNGEKWNHWEEWKTENYKLGSSLECTKASLNLEWVSYKQAGKRRGKKTRRKNWYYVNIWMGQVRSKQTVDYLAFTIIKDAAHQI